MRGRGQWECEGRSKVTGVLVKSTVGGNVSVLWVLLEGRVQLLEGGSVGWLEGPTGQHQLVDGHGALLGGLLQPVVLVLYHLQNLQVM